MRRQDQHELEGAWSANTRGQYRLGPQQCIQTYLHVQLTVMKPTHHWYDRHASLAPGVACVCGGGDAVQGVQGNAAGSSGIRDTGNGCGVPAISLSLAEAEGTIRVESGVEPSGKRCGR